MTEVTREQYEELRRIAQDLYEAQNRFDELRRKHGIKPGESFLEALGLDRFAILGDHAV